MGEKIVPTKSEATAAIDSTLEKVEKIVHELRGKKPTDIHSRDTYRREFEKARSGIDRVQEWFDAILELPTGL